MKFVGDDVLEFCRRLFWVEIKKDCCVAGRLKDETVLQRLDDWIDRGVDSCIRRKVGEYSSSAGVKVSLGPFGESLLERGSEVEQIVGENEFLKRR
jgi:hypothetical protein